MYIRRSVFFLAQTSYRPDQILGKYINFRRIHSTKNILQYCLRNFYGQYLIPPEILKNVYLTMDINWMIKMQSRLKMGKMYFKDTKRPILRQICPFQTL